MVFPSEKRSSESVRNDCRPLSDSYGSPGSAVQFVRVAVPTGPADRFVPSTSRSTFRGHVRSNWFAGTVRNRVICVAEFLCRLFWLGVCGHEAHSKCMVSLFLVPLCSGCKNHDDCNKQNHCQFAGSVIAANAAFHPRLDRVGSYSGLTRTMIADPMYHAGRYRRWKFMYHADRGTGSGVWGVCDSYGFSISLGDQQ